MNLTTGKISPSIMCANFKNLEQDIRELEAACVEYIHCDIMDGSFVPNFTLGPDFLNSIREMTDIPLDIHLMVNNPERHLELFNIKPNDYVSVHYESSTHIQRTLSLIKELGANVMLALNPGTPLCVMEDLVDDLDGVLIMTVNPGFAGQKLVPQTLDKIKRAKLLFENIGKDIEIEVDGNVSFENALKMRAAGADIFVAGTSSIFKKGESLSENTKKLRENIL